MQAFGDVGYGRATIAAIARTAQVAPATVHAVVGGKPQLVLALVERGTQLPEIAAVLQSATAESDPVQAVERLVAGVRRVQDDVAGVARVMAEAAASEPLVGDLASRVEAMTREGFTEFVEHLDALGVLRPHGTAAASRERAVDALWYLLGYPSWEVLTRMGWAQDQAEVFLREHVAHAVLGPR